VIDHNPSLRPRLLTGGDLRASVLAECEAAGGPVPSEAELARRCGASRPAVRDAVRTLRLAGLVRTAPRGRGRTVALRPAA
jgi:DNA-binding FadR family transcriptional regulator